MERPPPLQPISALNIVLQGNTNTDSNVRPSPQLQQQYKDPDITQVRSYVEKQMDQLQQDLEFGFSRTPKSTTASAASLPVNVTIYDKKFFHLFLEKN